MMQPATAQLRAANDNVAGARLASRRQWPLWMAVPCSLLALAALSGAFLIGLMMVGLVAPVMWGIDLVRERLGRPDRRWPLLTAK